MTDPFHIVVVEDDAVTRTKLAGVMRRPPATG